MPKPADTEVLGLAWLRGRDLEVPSWLSLSQVSELLRLPAEPPHHALGDALTTAKSFIALASHLDAAEPQTVGTLVGAGSRPRGVGRFGRGL